MLSFNFLQKPMCKRGCIIGIVLVCLSLTIHPSTREALCRMGALVIPDLFASPLSQHPADELIMFKIPRNDPANHEDISKDLLDHEDVLDEHIAACVATTEESPGLPKFPVYHYHHVGVRHFYIMDSGSESVQDSYAYHGIPESALTFTR